MYPGGISQEDDDGPRERREDSSLGKPQSPVPLLRGMERCAGLRHHSRWHVFIARELGTLRLSRPREADLFALTIVGVAIALARAFALVVTGGPPSILYCKDILWILHLVAFALAAPRLHPCRPSLAPLRGTLQPIDFRWQDAPLRLGAPKDLGREVRLRHARRDSARPLRDW